MTVPANIPSPPLRTTGPSRPGMRPTTTRSGPARNTPQNAFAQALSQAQSQTRGLQSRSLPGGTGAAPGSGGSAMPFAQQSGLPVEFQALASTLTPGVAAAAVPAARTLQVPGGFGPIVAQAAKKYGVDPALIAAVMETESKFNPEAVSQAGARGLMQLMPATARGLGVTDASDPLQNVLGGAKLLGQLTEKYQGNLELALAAYNAGSGAVDKHGGIPPYAETRKYVPLVMAAYERFRAQAGMPAPATPGRPTTGGM